jgi:tetratricopeptide (TPR) repeat protein
VFQYLKIGSIVGNLNEKSGMKKYFFFTVSFFFITAMLYSQPKNEAGSQKKGITPEVFSQMQLDVELQGSLAKPPELTALMDAAIQLAGLGKLDTPAVIRVHDRCREHLFTALKQDNLSRELVRETFLSLDKSLIDFLACDQVQAYYKSLLEKDSANRENLLSIVIALSGSYCRSCDLTLLLAKKLYDADSTPEHALYLARYFMTKNGYNFAYPLMEKAEKSKNPKISAEAYLGIASMYRFFNRFEESRKFATKALALDPVNNMPYLIIGDCYAMSAEICGTDSIGKTAAYWAAMDKYEKAVSIDPKLKPVAELRMKVASARFPSKDLLMKQKLKEGEPYKVECWIDEITRIRARKSGL